MGDTMWRVKIDTRLVLCVRDAHIYTQDEQPNSLTLCAESKFTLIRTTVDHQSLYDPSHPYYHNPCIPYYDLSNPVPDPSTPYQSPAKCPTVSNLQNPPRASLILPHPHIPYLSVSNMYTRYHADMQNKYMSHLLLSTMTTLPTTTTASLLRIPHIRRRLCLENL